LGKFIEKIIGEKLQRQSITSNFVHPNQLGGLENALPLIQMSIVFDWGRLKIFK